jgi:orotate phosphoribosyltransferase
VEIIASQDARPAGVVIALDRQERGQDERSAVDEVRQSYDIPVYSIVALADMITFLEECPDKEGSLQAVREYRALYGV